MQFFPSEHRKMPFSAAVRVGEVYYLSGEIGLRPDGSLPETFEAQVRQMLDNTVASLARLDLAVTDVFSVTVMLEDMSRWSAFNEIYLEYFTDRSRLPARAAFGTNGLAMGAFCEMQCMASRQTDRASSV